MMGLQSDEEKNQAQEIQKKEDRARLTENMSRHSRRVRSMFPIVCGRSWLAGQSARQHCGFGTRCRRAGCLKRTREPLLQSPW